MIWSRLLEKKPSIPQRLIIKERVMLEYRDGRFSENMDIESAMTKFRKAISDDQFGEDPFTIRALHVGTEEELNEIRLREAYHPESDKVDLQTQINDLKEQLEAIKPVKSSFIHIPTDQERKALQDIMDAGKKKETVFLFD